jgi:hypothetical protein
MTETFEAWGIVDLFGKQRLAGRISERIIAGVSMLRIDIPDKDNPEKFRTVYHGGAAIYGLHPTDETIARAAAAAAVNRPTYEYQVEDALRRLQAPSRAPLMDDDEDDH